MIDVRVLKSRNKRLANSISHKIARRIYFANKNKFSMLKGTFVVLLYLFSPTITFDLSVSIIYDYHHQHEPNLVPCIHLCRCCLYPHHFG